MACQVFVGREAGTERERACLYDPVTGWAFGPLFEDETEATAFLESRPHRDPRQMTDEELGRAVVWFRGRGKVV